MFPGGILVPLTFGVMANWNPHVNALVTDTCWDREGNCYPMPEIDSKDIKEIEKLFAVDHAPCLLVKAAAVGASEELCVVAPAARTLSATSKGTFSLLY